MVFDAREAAAEAVDLEPFEFIGLDGVTYELPNLLTLTERELAAVRAGDETVVRERAPEGYEALQDMPRHVSLRLGEEWWAQMGEAGKSPAPSRTTRRAAGRSTPTLRSAASTSPNSKSARSQRTSKR